MPLAAICLYDWFFVRRNDFSQNREYKIINRPFESGIIGSLLTKRITQQVKNYIYKQDTEEVLIVKKALKRLIEANNLQKSFAWTEGQDLPVAVTLVHNDTIMMFLNLD